MNYKKEKQLWIKIFNKNVKRYPKKSINFLTKKTLIEFKNVKNKKIQESRSKSSKTKSKTKSKSNSSKKSRIRKKSH